MSVQEPTHRLLLIAGIGKHLLADAKSTFKWCWSEGRLGGTLGWLAMITLVGAVVRGYFLSQPMRYEEAATFLNYANGNLGRLFWYPLPNNHVLHSVLVWFSVHVFGKHPVSIRAPAFLAGLMTIPATFWVARLLSVKENVGYVAAAMVSVFPYLVLFDTMARGYSILVVLSLLLVGLTIRLVETGSAADILLVGLVAALGLFDIPTFVFPAAGAFLWMAILFVQRGRSAVWILTRVMIPLGMLVLAFMGLFYAPVFYVNHGINSLINNRWVASLLWQEFFVGIPIHFLATARRFTMDVPPLALFISILCFALGCLPKVGKRRWTMLTLLVGLAAGAAVPLVAEHAVPYARSWIYLLPFYFIPVDQGFEVLTRLKAGLVIWPLIAISAFQRAEGYLNRMHLRGSLSL